MPTIQFTVTNAALRRLLDETNVGAAALRITRLALGDAGAAPDGTETGLGNQIATADFHGTVDDGNRQITGTGLFTGAAAITADEVGIFAEESDGTEFLFAYAGADGVTQFTKPANEDARLAVAVKFLNAMPATITFENSAIVQFVTGEATVVEKGIARLATDSEIISAAAVPAIVAPRQLRLAPGVLQKNRAPVHTDTGEQLTVTADGTAIPATQYEYPEGQLWRDETAGALYQLAALTPTSVAGVNHAVWERVSTPAPPRLQVVKLFDGSASNGTHSLHTGNFDNYNLITVGFLQGSQAPPGTQRLMTAPLQQFKDAPFGFFDWRGSEGTNGNCQYASSTTFRIRPSEYSGGLVRVNRIWGTRLA